ncbi:MAG TPA: SLC13 family permease [Verrucomicrobiae bacterium]|nr:SLC13 family permease [Verrucomicrobiae bacterium]
MPGNGYSSIPLFRGLDRVDLARLVPRLGRIVMKKGETVFSKGDTGDSLFIIVDGRVRINISNEKGETRETRFLGLGEFFGEMALLTGEPRSATVVAETDVVFLRLFRSAFEELTRKHNSLALYLAATLAGRLQPASPGIAADRTPDEAGRHRAAGPPAAKGAGFSVATCIAATAILILSAASGAWLYRSGMGREHVVLLELMAAATLCWSLNILNYHAVAVALPVLAVILGAARPEKAFSGFSSSSWFLVLGIFAISGAISRTGLLYRIVLLVLRRFPPGYFGQSLALAVAGLLLTPVIPSSNGRATLAGPVVVAVSETMRFRNGSPGAIGMAMAALLGFGHMSFMFMNGTATCFLALGLLPPEVSAAVTWGSWIKAALPLGLAYFFGSYAVIVWLYRPGREPAVKAAVVEAQLDVLGPMTRGEKICLAVVVFSLAGFITQPWHGVNPAWVAMSSFLILFGGGVIDEKAVRSDIDWNFLISFGALVGFGSMISASGLAALAAERLRPCMELFGGSTFIFLVVIALGVNLLRLLLPLPASILLSLVAVVPAVSALGMNPFLFALVVLISGNAFFTPYQNSIYLNMVQATEGRLFRHRHVMALSAWQVAVIICAIAVAVPCWRYLGLVR